MEHEVYVRALRKLESVGHLPHLGYHFIGAIVFGT